MEIGDNARLTVEKDHGIQLITAKMLEIYESLLTT